MQVIHPSLAFSNIFGNGQRAYFASDFHRFRRKLGDADFSRSCAEIEFHAVVFPLDGDGLHRLLHSLRIDPKSELPEVVADDFLAQITRSRFEGFVDVNDSMIRER